MSCPLTFLRLTVVVYIGLYRFILVFIGLYWFILVYICSVCSVTVDPSKGKKFRSCEQFLSQIDATGAYTSCLEGKEVDPARQRRLVV